MSEIVERLRSSAPLPLCPFERRSPEYWTTPNDKPCKFCGGLPEGPDKCTGADMRIMLEAADRIETLERENAELRERCDNDEIWHSMERARDEAWDQVDKLRAALEQSIIAIDDWLNIFAEELCDPKRVAEAKARVHEYGTLWYIATTQDANRAAIRALSSTERSEG